MLQSLGAQALQRVKAAVAGIAVGTAQRQAPFHDAVDQIEGDLGLSAEGDGFRHFGHLPSFFVLSPFLVQIPLPGQRQVSGGADPVQGDDHEPAVDLADTAEVLADHAHRQFAALLPNRFFATTRSTDPSSRSGLG